MNAYELADEYEYKLNWKLINYIHWSNQAETLLRQQADRIAKLESYLEAYKTRVAELENQLDKCSHHEAMAHQGGYELGKASQIKELSDEEIKECADSVCHAWKKNGVGELYMGDFARAILKKASEK